MWVVEGFIQPEQGQTIEEFTRIYHWGLDPIEDLEDARKQCLPNNIEDLTILRCINLSLIEIRELLVIYIICRSLRQNIHIQSREY